MFEMRADINSSYVVYVDKGTSEWDEGYPVGHGRIGLLAFGSYPNETFHLKQRTFDLGQTRRRLSRERTRHYGRNPPLGSRDYKAAESLFTREFFKPDWRPGSYEYAGHGNIEHVGIGEPKSIENTLDLRTGLSKSVAVYEDGMPH